MTSARRRLKLVCGGTVLVTSVLICALALTHAVSPVAAQDAGGGLSAFPGMSAFPGTSPTPTTSANPAATPGPTATPDPANAGCLTDTEPNDTPETAATFSGPACIAGSLPDGDQDLYLWTVTEAQAAGPWDITLDGVDGTVTGAKVLAVTSAPGETPLVIGNVVAEVDQPVDAFEPAAASGLLFPAGEYLVGIARSATADGNPPLDVGYRVRIDAGTPLPPSGDVEPNDDLTTATALSGAFAISGDLRDSQDVYRWTTPDLEAGQAWDVQLTGALTSGAQVSIQDATGTTLASAYPDALGRAELADLRLPAGDHFLFVTPSTSVSMPYALSATAGDLGNADPEPNSVVAVAVPLDPARPIVHGRLAAGDNRDWYSLDVDQTLAASLLDIRLIWRSGPARTLCLADAAGTELQCRNGDHGVSLSGLHLSPGVAMLEVSGDPSDGSVYLLRVDPTTAPAADFESEPNDMPSTASAVSGLTMHGHLATDDRDTFLVTTTGEPQLWQVDVTGTGINALIWEKADGTELGLGDVAEDHSSAHATDLYLIPGEHWLRVDGSDGDYTLAMTALGPPDPNGEREPNNASINAEPFIIGNTRTGRLPSYQDVDIFRFTVDTTDHLRITVTPPSDGAVRMTLSSGAYEAGDIPGVVGAPTIYDAQLEPGDWELALRPDTPSLGKYSLAVERRGSVRHRGGPGAQRQHPRRPAPAGQPAHRG